MKVAMLLSLLFLLFSLGACTQGKAVKQQREYPAHDSVADDVDEKDDEESAQEDSDSGEENEVEISLSDLPQSIVDAINARFVGAQLMEADKIKPKRGKYFYDVEMLYQGKVIEVMYDKKGQMIGEETEDD